MLYPIDLLAVRLDIDIETLRRHLALELVRQWGPNNVYYQTLPLQMQREAISILPPPTCPPDKILHAHHRASYLLNYHKSIGCQKDSETLYKAYVATLPPADLSVWGHRSKDGYIKYVRAQQLWTDYIQSGLDALMVESPIPTPRLIVSETESRLLAVLYHPDPARRRPNISNAELQRLLSATMDNPPHVNTIARWRKKWLSENAALALSLTDPDKHRSKYRMSLGKADAEITRPLQRIELDGTVANVVCNDGKRYNIAAAIDVYTRRVIALVQPTATAYGQNLLTRRIVVEWGVPDEVYIDNGSDYVAREARSVWEALQVNLVVLPPYRPDLKPHIESFFKTLANVSHRWPGFVGASVAERKSIESRLSFATRREGEAVIRTDWTPARLQEALNAWIETEYHEREHSGIGMSPAQRTANWSGPIKQIADIRQLDILLQPVIGTRMYSKTGIHVQGRAYAPLDPAAMPPVGSKVQVRLSHNLGAIYIYSAATGAYLTDAIDHTATGVDRRQIALTIAAVERGKLAEGKKTLKRKVKEEAKKEMGEGVAGYAAANAAANHSARVNQKVQALRPNTKVTQTQSQHQDVEVKHQIKEMRGLFRNLKEDILSEADIEIEDAKEKQRIENELNTVEKALVVLEESATAGEKPETAVTSRLEKFFQNLADKTSRLGKVLETVDHSTEKVRNLFKIYNKFAQNIGLPSIPFLGKD